MTAVLDDIAGKVARLTDGWSETQQSAFAAQVRAEAARRRSLYVDCSGPLDLARTLSRRVVRTPALELVSAELERAITTPGYRLMISVSPQEGKTGMIRHAVIRALQHHPDRRSAIASYAVDLARTSGRAIRQMIDQFGTGARDPGSSLPLPDRLGIAVASDHAAAADWSLRGRIGGLYCVGVGGGLTGRPVDGVLFVDDPVKGRADADSSVMRQGVKDWWTSVSETRLGPEASVVIVMTRWHEDDLIGWLLGSETADEWHVVSIPALADGSTPDSLGRPVGEWMISARGRTVEQWEKIRKRVGERTFHALYQGTPTPLQGGVFHHGWFDTWRVAEAPTTCDPPVVVVDPADGGRDEAGLILAAKDRASGKAYVIDDLSGNMTVARWARLALLTCVRRNAPTLAYEKSLSQLAVRIREAWEELHQQATALRKAKGDQRAALVRLSRTDDSVEAREQIELALAEIVDDVDGILGMGQSGPRRVALVARGSKAHRMMLVAPAFETGRAVMVGTHSQAEWQLSTWQVGQDSPDRADAVVHAVAMLAGISGVASLGRANDRVPTSSTQLRTRSSSRLTRSTRR